ncbi:DUF6458 family protein [Actinomadura alba]|uniref:DUF6458 domain-containing protein n=1 Tax=Actinomadura alba TaxID=406431 RepID=A0ABR7LN58_9ACTN|nr:DUF6458 family protein [Actinomadura alba]MBC6466181.1 hypothetical protein [Actinomadura alba]
MGLGVSLVFFAIGAILAFAVRFDLPGIDIHMIGWIFILVSLLNLAFTLMYTRPRRRAASLRAASLADVQEDPLYVVRPEEPMPHVHVERRVVDTPVQDGRPHTQPTQPVPPQADPTQTIPPQAGASTRSSQPAEPGQPVPPRPTTPPDEAAPAQQVRETTTRRRFRP